jgi:hypothetical protein
MIRAVLMWISLPSFKAKLDDQCAGRRDLNAGTEFGRKEFRLFPRREVSVLQLFELHPDRTRAFVNEP